MIEYDRRQPLIFLHIPKTAGTSARTIFQSWFGSGWYPHYFDLNEGVHPPKYKLFDEAPLPTPSVIFGHFNRTRQLGVQDYYPQASQFITILRDPFEQILSRYFFLRHHRQLFDKYRDVPNDGLAQHVETAKSNMLDFFPQLVTKENYQYLIETTFVEIGITEKLSASMERIALKIGFPFTPDELGHENVTVRDKTIDLNLRDKFRERHELEYLVYDYVAQRY